VKVAQIDDFMDDEDLEEYQTPQPQKTAQSHHLFTSRSSRVVATQGGTCSGHRGILPAGGLPNELKEPTGGHSRLYMSNKRRKVAAYGDFGTGVFDREDNDTWDDIYDQGNCAQYDLALKNDDADEEVQQTTSHQMKLCAPGSSGSLGDTVESVDVTKPNGFFGVHSSHGSALDESRHRSVEDWKLLNSQKKQNQRMTHLKNTAELLEEPARSNTAEALNSEMMASSSLEANKGASLSLQRVETGKPLWNRIANDQQKKALLENLGCSFVTAQNQDMHEFGTRPEPCKSDLSLNASSNTGLASKPQRTVCPWTPEPLLCKRWGLPALKPSKAVIFDRPRNTSSGALPQSSPPQQASSAGNSTKLQPNSVVNTDCSSSFVQPAKSLFTAIFGDVGSDDGI